MISLCIQYPSKGGGRFDFEYYLSVHLPMAERLLSEYGFRDSSVYRCTGTLGGETPEFLCITILEFESLDGLREGMRNHGAELSADFSQYTDITPVATVTELAE